MIELIPVHKKNIHFIEDWLNEDRNLRILGRLKIDEFGEKDREAYVDRHKTWTFLIYSGIVPVGYTRITHSKKGIADIGIVLTAPNRHQGIGYEVAQSLLRIAKKLEKRRAMWVTAEFNTPSIRLAEKLGFQLKLKDLDSVDIDGQKYHRLIYTKEIDNV
jgi:RimJ/RimL family protein N-acetyltransferase